MASHKGLLWPAIRGCYGQPLGANMATTTIITIIIITITITIITITITIITTIIIITIIAIIIIIEKLLGHKELLWPAIRSCYGRTR